MRLPLPYPPPCPACSVMSCSRGPSSALMQDSMLNISGIVARSGYKTDLAVFFKKKRNTRKDLLTMASLRSKKLEKCVGTNPGAMQLTRVSGPISAASAWSRNINTNLLIIFLKCKC